MKRQLLTLPLIAWLALSGCTGGGTTQSPPRVEDYAFGREDARSLSVGVYLDYGVFGNCRNGTVTMLNEMRCPYELVTRDTIADGGLDRYRLLIMPGGDMYRYRTYLGDGGMAAIKSFVERGGGYIGVCGGSYFAAARTVWHGWAGKPRENIVFIGLGLWDAVAEGPIENFAPGYVDEQCAVRLVDRRHPVTHNLPETIPIHYDHGPAFLCNASVPADVLGTTVNGGKTILAAFRCGAGRVFLTGVHPELSGSRISWVMMKNAIVWCSRTRP